MNPIVVARESVYDFGTNVPGALDRDGICKVQSVIPGAESLFLVMNGDAVSGGAWAAPNIGGRKVTIYSASNNSDKRFTISGTDHRGVEAPEEIDGPTAGATVTTTTYFQSVTSVEVQSDCTNVEVGFSTALFACDISRLSAKHFQVSPTNGVNFVVAIYGKDGWSAYDTGILQRCTVKLTKGASGTFAWAQGSAPPDCNIRFAGGVEQVPTSNGTDLYEFVTEGREWTSGYAFWFCVNAAKDVKA